MENYEENQVTKNPPYHGVIPSQIRSYSCTAVYTFIGIKIRASTRYEVMDYEDFRYSHDRFRSNF